MRKDGRKRFVGQDFKSAKALDKIPIDREFTDFILAEVRRLFPYHRRNRITVEFCPQATGPWGIWGQTQPRRRYIKIWRRGMTLGTLLHEIAHVLAPLSSGHNKDFYAACDLLEKELFSPEV